MPPLWWLTKDGDLDCLELYRRHYSRYVYADGREPDLFVGPGEKGVFRTERADAVWAWRKFVDDCIDQRTGERQQGVNCAVFRTSQASLFDRLTPSLISRGLIAGITPTSIRKKSPQGILDIAFSSRGGRNAE